MTEHFAGLVVSWYEEKAIPSTPAEGSQGFPKKAQIVLSSTSKEKRDRKRMPKLP